MTQKIRCIASWRLRLKLCVGFRIETDEIESIVEGHGTRLKCLSVE